MSCWVAPAIAAELWGLSLRDIQEMIRRGRLTTQTDNGFSFVRLPNFSIHGLRRPPEARPSTFAAVTPDELNALHQTPPGNNGHGNTGHSGNGQGNHDHSGGANNGDESEDGPPPDEDPHDNRIADWRSGRRAASQRRRPPGSFNA